MPSAISVHINEPQLRDLKKLVNSLGGRAANRALSRAINRTLGVQHGGMRSVISKEIRRDVNIQQKYLYKQNTGRRSINTFNIKRATVNNPTGSIRTLGPNTPLVEYSNQRGHRSRYAKSIYVKVQKSRGRHKLQHAFVPKLESGYHGIFVRQFPGAKGPRGRKIKKLFGSRIPDVLGNELVLNRVHKIGSDRFERELNHQIDYIMKSRNY